MQRRLPTTLVFKRGIYKRKAIAMALETSTGELLRVSGLTASVDEKEILHGIDLSVAQGETHVLMGPNGAGKSTLGHVVMGDPT